MEHFCYSKIPISNINLSRPSAGKLLPEFQLFAVAVQRPINLLVPCFQDPIVGISCISWNHGRVPWCMGRVAYVDMSDNVLDRHQDIRLLVSFPMYQKQTTYQNRLQQVKYLGKNNHTSLQCQLSIWPKQMNTSTTVKIYLWTMLHTFGCVYASLYWREFWYIVWVVECATL